jgi:glycosyltransferase involved in cell wall biosynthesis
MPTLAEPSVSVIIPTRDRPHLLREAIGSVRDQSITDHEIIVVVNGPENPQTASSLEVANAAGCTVIRIERAGIAVALNAGIKAARGEWLALLDDDDLWAPHKLETQLNVANATAADVVFCDFCMFDTKGCAPNPRLRPPPSLTVAEAMMMRNYGGGCSVALLRRTAVLAVGGFDESITSPDWDLWIRLAWQTRFAWADAQLVRVRQHGKNSSTRMPWGQLAFRTQYKALRNLPRNLRHRRLPILGQMLKTAGKATESYVRHNYLQALRKHFPKEAAKAKAPLPCPLTLSPALRNSGAGSHEASCSFGDAVITARKTDHQRIDAN